MNLVATVQSEGKGTCCNHPPTGCIPMVGFIYHASHKSFANGRGMARVGDIVVGTCNHTGIITSGSAKTYVDGSKVALVTSVFTGAFSGMIISGASTVYAV